MVSFDSTLFPFFSRLTCLNAGVANIICVSWCTQLRPGPSQQGGRSKGQPSMETRSVRGFWRSLSTQIDKYPNLRDQNDTGRQSTVGNSLKQNGIKFLKQTAQFVASWYETAFSLTGQEIKGNSAIIRPFSTAGCFFIVYGFKNSCRVSTETWGKISPYPKHFVKEGGW